MINIIDLPHELVELIVELSDDKSALYLAMVIRSPIIEKQAYLKNKFTRMEEVDGIIVYRLPDGRIHREYDLPAKIYANGDQVWYYNGQCHRSSADPSVVCVDGTQMWYYEGKLHRGSNVDLPAVIYGDGGKIWYYDERVHRSSGTSDPTLPNDGTGIIYFDGIQEMYFDGECLRENDLTIYRNGTQLWYYNGKLHRSINPAVICVNGGREWWYNGERYFM